MTNTGVGDRAGSGVGVFGGGGVGVRFLWRCTLAGLLGSGIGDKDCGLATLLFSIPTTKDTSLSDHKFREEMNSFDYVYAYISKLFKKKIEYVSNK